jgi:D-alanyl-D-alanine carboxypeptidase (penicillin-binding protein 5/6)
MFLKAEQTPTVDALLRGLIVQSGNDAALTLATHIAGGEKAFVKLMNKSAKRLGLRNTYFTNPSGLPDPGHYSTANDLAKLAATIVRDYPQHYPLFSEREFSFNDFSQSNRNRLLWLDPYTDGMKTGYTRRAGYCLIASTKRGKRRLISVLIGAKSDNIRTQGSQKLLNFGFQNFDAVRLYQQEQAVTTTHVWEGTEQEIAIGFKVDLVVSVPKGKLKQLKATLKIYQPIAAPISRGQKLGILKLTLAGKPFAEYPIVALDKVSVANIFSRGWDNIRLFIHNL